MKKRGRPPKAFSREATRRAWKAYRAARMRAVGHDGRGKMGAPPGLVNGDVNVVWLTSCAELLQENAQQRGEQMTWEGAIEAALMIRLARLHKTLDADAMARMVNKWLEGVIRSERRWRMRRATMKARREAAIKKARDEVGDDTRKAIEDAEAQVARDTVDGVLTFDARNWKGGCRAILPIIRRGKRAG